MDAIYAAPKLGKTPANHVPLSPISMLKRTALVHPDRVATMHGDSVRTSAENELLEHCRERLDGLKRPKRLIFGELPKTSTGKIRKNELRDLARSTT